MPSTYRNMATIPGVLVIEDDPIIREFVICPDDCDNGFQTFGKMSVGVFSAARPPKMRIRIAITANVYGRFRAMRTIAFMRARAQVLQRKLRR